MRESKNEAPWSKGDIKLLKDNWGKLSCTALGRLFKPVRSKNSIIGKAGRLDLPALESAMEMNKRRMAEGEADGKKPRSPREMLRPTEPRKLDTPWNIWTHWEPGLPSLWEHKTTEMPSFRCCLDAVMCWHQEAP